MRRKRRVSGLEFTIGYQAKMPLKKKSQRKDTCQTWISHRIWSSVIWPDDVQPFRTNHLFQENLVMSGKENRKSLHGLSI